MRLPILLPGSLDYRYQQSIVLCSQDCFYARTIPVGSASEVGRYTW